MSRRSPNKEGHSPAPPARQTPPPSVSEGFDALQTLVNYGNIYVYTRSDTSVDDHIIHSLQGVALDLVCNTVFPPARRQKQTVTPGRTNRNFKGTHQPKKKKVVTYHWIFAAKDAGGSPEKKDSGSLASATLAHELLQLHHRYSDFPQLTAAFNTLGSIADNYRAWRTSFAEKMLPSDSYHMKWQFKKRMRLKGKRNPVVIPHSEITGKTRSSNEMEVRRAELIALAQKNTTVNSQAIQKILGNF